MDPKLIAVRAALQQHGLGAVIVPSQDPHQSEYVADHWNAREWISGFTGSAGTAVVTTAEAGLWTDSRYFLQAERELAGGEVTFHKQVVPGAPEHLAWLSKRLEAGDRVAIDGALLSQDGLDAIHA
jgi:Xaa-Pro aminopeptidase